MPVPEAVPMILMLYIQCLPDLVEFPQTNELGLDKPSDMCHTLPDI